ncbi:FG-GAP repeat domain-containing protein [Streptomyces sp. 039-1]|uniref:FG-GAP repeat domain-containing protein n=1 Tax=Streptomyces sp. 039-1 TaxID=2789263 RepID=UPI0039F5E0FB
MTLTAVLAALCTSAQNVRAGDSRLPPAGRATPSPRTEYFNGDGYDDFAAVMQGRRVVVVDGTAHGPDPQLRTVSQLPSRKEHRPETQLLRADLDHDGYTDLVHAPSGREPAVQWGGLRGLSTAQTLAGVPGDLGITGDFDGDGAADLYVGGDTTTAGTVWYRPDPVPPSRNRAAPCAWPSRADVLGGDATVLTTHQ